jgi:hypothetical protein
VLKLSLFIVAFSLFLVSGNAFLCGLFGCDNPTFLIVDTDLNISDLLDVNVNSLLDNQILVFNSTTLQWENQNQAGAAGTRTYTGIAPITVDNDNNLLGWNPNTGTDFNGTLDGFEGADLNLTVIDFCFGDANSIRTSANNCQDITSFGIGGVGGGDDTWAVINGAIPWVDANVSDGITLTNITQITNRAFTDLTGKNFSLLFLDDNSSFDARYLPHLLRTYTGISPITADNDNNLLGLNVTPTTDWNGLFDGNDSTFYIDWSNSVNRLFSLLSLDDNSSFDARYSQIDTNAETACSAGEVLFGDGTCGTTGGDDTFNVLSPVIPWADVNVSDGITLTNITQITSRAFENITDRNFSLLVLDDNSAFDARYLPHLLRSYTGISPITVDNDNNLLGLNVLPTSDWNGLFDGNSSDVYMRDANLVAKGILSVNPRYLSIDDGELNFDSNTQDLLHFFNGTFLETIDVDVNSNGTDVNLFMQKEGGGDLIIVFDSGDGFVFFDATPPATIELTAGSDTNPTLNYVFVPQSTNVLTVNTTGFPSNAEHAPIATVVVQSAASVVVDGAYKVHVWTDHSDDENTHQGHESHINSWIRKQPATWQSAVSQTLTITTNASQPDNVDFAVTSGTVLQLHDHAYPAFDTASDSNIFVVNDSGAAFTKVDDLNALLTDSTGASMSGRYFTLVVWGVVSEDSGDSKLMLNLPSGSYNKESDATDDVSGFDNFSIPSDFVGTGFLISKLVLRHQAASGGTWTSIQEGDLRGLFPSVAAAGGSGAAITEFPDNLFSLFNVTDSTKELRFDLSGISTGNERLWNVQDANGTVPLLEFFNTWDENQLFSNQSGICFDQSDCDVRIFSGGFNRLTLSAPARVEFLTGGESRLSVFATEVVFGSVTANTSWDVAFDTTTNSGMFSWEGSQDFFVFDDNTWINARLDVEDLNVNNTHLLANDINYSFADFNISVLANCVGDTNSVLNNLGDCIDITGFEPQNDTTKLNVPDYNVTTLSPGIFGGTDDYLFPDDLNVTRNVNVDQNIFMDENKFVNFLDDQNVVRACMGFDGNIFSITGSGGC